MKVCKSPRWALLRKLLLQQLQTLLPQQLQTLLLPQNKQARLKQERFALSCFSSKANTDRYSPENSWPRILRTNKNQSVANRSCICRRLAVAPLGIKLRAHVQYAF